MEFEGTLKKDKKTQFWIAEVAAFDLMTQGTSKDDAISMLKDAIMELLNENFSKEVIAEVALEVHFYSENFFGLKSYNSKVLIALALRRQREQAGVSVREVSKRMQVTSPNAYAQYERGKVNISIEMLDRLLHAINPSKQSVIRLV